MRLMTEILQKAKAYLDARRGERVTLGELAQAVAASPFHLQRRFKDMSIASTAISFRAPGLD